MVSGDLMGPMMQFLLSTGYWAMTQLGEFWKLRRRGSDGQDVEADVSKESDPNENKKVEKMAQDILNSHKPESVQRVMKDVERMKGIIDQERSAMLADREELGRGNIPLAVLEARKEFHEKTIAEYRKEIEQRLREIGVSVSQ